MMPDDASITILVPGVLRRESGGAAALRLRGVATLGEALAELERRRPALYRSVCDETGAVRRHVNLFVNTEHMRDRNGLDTPLAPGDEVIIMPAVSGG
ncbi:MAG: MoaD/ThiS family protein [Verrucomicrobia bacterium]|nr:MoaD/ThiS family protein [Verrucomicrobiota bacterium]